ncbi:hypothetical protein MCQ_01291 [Candidatus Bartonella washoeensis Sb944nv]|uniref:BL00235/CARNS1 N-terminal domain-containing protein n=1 Tax=Candidatus Bartonella washoeensis Sb944nv TaxID=1094563 RepID=J1J2Z7_9HYPH|nr:hypothetical protein [Bartonella washoeensis]EJF78457.1 hypothetical protein MCQ_01291 [Bartonella washoeensis Sb944nv]
MEKHIVLLSPHHAMIDCAQRNGIKMTIFDKPENGPLTAYMNQDSVFLFDYHNVPFTKKIISAIHSHRKIDAIITLTEKALPLASQLSRFLGLKTLSWETIERIQNKYAMRLFLSDHAEYSLKFLKPKNKKE